MIPEAYASFSLLTTKIALLKRARNQKLHHLGMTVPDFKTIACAYQSYNEI